MSEKNETIKRNIFADREAAFRAGNYILSPVLDGLFNNKVQIAPELERILSGWRTEQARLNSVIQSLVIDSGIKEMLAGIDKQVTAAARVFEEITAPSRLIAEGLHAALSATSPFIEGMARMQRMGAFLQASGWLPHYTFPFSSVDGFENDVVGFNKAITEHYEIEWKKTKEAMLKNIEACLLEKESKEVFAEAIKAHETGLYRSVIRLLFPEIERISRIDHHGNKMDGIASVPELRKAAGGLTANTVTFQPYFSLEFFGRLVEHVYVKVDKDNVRKFLDDPVPNRHAALHGHVTYNSEQSSLNMLFMADYIFQVISALRIADEEEKNKLNATKLT